MNEINETKLYRIKVANNESSLTIPSNANISLSNELLNNMKQYKCRYCTMRCENPQSLQFHLLVCLM